MLDPPSESLLQVLLGQNVCSERDLRRCRGRVRRLTRDLPAFDSVWLDVLVQDRKLTPFQLRLLESSRPEQIGVGPCLLLDRLGGGPSGNTYLARPRDSREPCVIKCVPKGDLLSPEAIDRLEMLVGHLDGFSHPSIVVPHAWDRVEGQLVLIARHIDGPHLGELLVRRGRFPADAVLEIGRQLCEGLQELAQAGYSHGDLRIANVRLTSAGVAVLVDTGVRSALDPELTIHAALPPERFDGVAPELIGTGQPPNVASDLYALGCLLWQLLAGRPPFPGGSPLGKLAAHQTKRIDDVRKWAPDTPPLLAEGIRRCTARDPCDRPVSFAEVLEYWDVPRRSGKKHLSAFRRRFDTATQNNDRPASVLNWLLLFAVLFVASGAAVQLSDAGARSNLLALATRLTDRVREKIRRPQTRAEPSHPSQPETTTSSAPAANEPQPLPAPDDRGVLTLTTAGPYLAEDIAAVGPLVIRGSPTAPAEIIVGEKPLKIWAESVRLEHVRLRTEIPSRAAGLAALLIVESQSLEIVECEFRSRCQIVDGSTGEQATDKTTGPAAIAWKTLGPRDPDSGKFTIRETVIIGDGPALYLASPARLISASHCLKIGRGPLFHLNTAASPVAGRNLQLQLSNITCRRSGAVLRWEIAESWKPRAQVILTARDCVFDVPPAAASLVEFFGPQERSDWPSFVQMTGEGSVAPPELQLASWINATSGSIKPLDGSKLQLEGISTSEFSFAGPPTNRMADSVVTGLEGLPRRSPEPPGIAARLDQTRPSDTDSGR